MKAPKIEFTSDRYESGGGWSRNVKVGELEYAVSVSRDKPARIAFKPRGQNRGWTWVGRVFRIGDNAGQIWSGDVAGSIGARGLLIRAGVVPNPKTGRTSYAPAEADPATAPPHDPKPRKVYPGLEHLKVSR